jgi:hypothetical protein
MMASLYLGNSGSRGSGGGRARIVGTDKKVIRLQMMTTWQRNVCFDCYCLMYYNILTVKGMPPLQYIFSCVLCSLPDYSHKAKHSADNK